VKLRRGREKIVSRDRAVATVAAWQRAGDTVVFANGVFDLLHVGHVRYLTGARQSGTRLVVGINDDRSAAELKGRGRPVLPAEERALLIASLRAVDLVVVFGEPTADQLIRDLAPHVHAKGTDYRPETVPERASTAAIGGKTVVAGDDKSHASRELVEQVRRRVRDGRV
jgi:rfaE bifunctional protein nucleotidyltransferase chain/domain